MAEAVLIGAGLGAGGAMISGQDPFKGAMVGGAVGGASAGFGGAGVTSGAGVSNGASHLAQTGAQQATANASMGGLGNTIGSGFTNLTGMTGQDLAQMGMQEGIKQVATPEQQQQIQHAPENISRPQVDLAQGVPTMTSNPRLRKIKLQQGLL